MSEPVQVEDWAEEQPAQFREFPGPASAAAAVPFRVAFDRDPCADVYLHAREHLDEEVCGVLVGEVFADDRGRYVHVRGVIRGDRAKQGRAQVTFTHETWEEIHRVLEERFPTCQIVGWYHSHPGFGVEFSDMDRFIHENFFSGPMQVAQVVDPLSGQMALLFNGPGGLDYVDRLWVDGREQACNVPGGAGSGAAPASQVGHPVSGQVLQDLETRMSQLVQTVDEQREALYRFQVFLGMVVTLGVALWLGWSVWQGKMNRLEPPRQVGYAPIPVQVGDKTVLLGVSVTSWQVPDELNAIYRQLGEEVLRQARERGLLPSGVESPGAGSSSPAESEGKP